MEASRETNVAVSQLLRASNSIFLLLFSHRYVTHGPATFTFRHQSKLVLERWIETGFGSLSSGCFLALKQTCEPNSFFFLIKVLLKHATEITSLLWRLLQTFKKILNVIFFSLQSPGLRRNKSNSVLFHSGSVVFHHLIHLHDWVIASDFLQMCCIFTFPDQPSDWDMSFPELHSFCWHVNLLLCCPAE